MRETGIVFLFAQTHHPAMRHVAAARRAIGKRTIFNLLGPLANPARVKRQLVGVFAEEWLTPYAEALRALGSERAMVVHGRDGLDELTTTDITYVATLADGVITRSQIAPEDAGLKRASLAAASGRRRRRECQGAPGAFCGRKKRLSRYRAAECRRGPDGGGARKGYTVRHGTGAKCPGQRCGARQA